jgi:6-pyruvoyltetrahydropterin/6-carboxytetrahydropterin synthase
MSHSLKVGRVFTFDSAHHLPNYQGMCHEVHGHTYKLEILITKALNAQGMVFDFAEFKSIVENLLKSKYDHKDLNTVLENPTAENLILEIKNDLDLRFRSLHIDVVRLKLWETGNSYAQLDIE